MRRHTLGAERRDANVSKPVDMLDPWLDDATYVFASVPKASPAAREAAVLGRFEEAEGLTLVLEAGEAARFGLPARFPCRRITLRAVTALETVGLLALVSGALARCGIAVNPIAGFYHDHLFVPVERAEEALAVLRALPADKY